MTFPFGRRLADGASETSLARRRPRLGVVLGGGAARGWAHIGVMRELSALGLRPDVVVGSSIGAVIGGCFASDRLDALENFALSLTRRRVFGLLDLSFAGGGLIGGERLRTRLENALGEALIESLGVRFAAVATEIGTGHEIWLSRGRLVEALRASYALPGIFEPVKIGERWLFDGAIVNPIPVGVARALGAEQVIAVTVQGDGAGYGASLPTQEDEEVVAVPAPEAAPPLGMFSLWRESAASLLRRQWGANGGGAPGLASVMVNAFNITQDRITRARLAGDPPDTLIPVKVGSIGLFEFHRAAELIAIGREAVRRQREEILAHAAAAGGEV